jgi:hypothetical protein
MVISKSDAAFLRALFPLIQTDLAARIMGWEEAE